MQNISISDARRLLGLPAHGRVSRQRLNKAYQKAFRFWIIALSSAIGGSKRQRARDVLTMLPKAQAVLKLHPTAKRKKSQSVPNKGASKQPKVTIRHPTELLEAYETIRKAIEGTATFFEIPKIVVVVIFILFLTIMFQGCLDHVVKTINGAN